MIGNQNFSSYLWKLLVCRNAREASRQVLGWSALAILLVGASACSAGPIGASRWAPGDPVAGGAPSVSRFPGPDPVNEQDRSPPLGMAQAGIAASNVHDRELSLDRVAVEAAASRAASDRAAAEAAARDAMAASAAAEESARRAEAVRAEVERALARLRAVSSSGVKASEAARGAGPAAARVDARDQSEQGQQERGPMTIRVGPDGDFKTIAAAARRARSGDIVEVQAGDYRGDVAVWTQKELTIRSVGGRAVLYADGKSAERKGIWVVRGSEMTVDGFDFIGARVGSGNGAGIRFDRGKLTVRNSRFIDNQMGILTGNNADSELIVENSEFSGVRSGSKHYHNIYVGSIARFELRGSWIHDARVGHLVKSRARESFVFYNRITDESGNGSYELEFPAGGRALVVGNLIEQSPQTDNFVLVSFGVEGYRWPENRLAMAHNTLVNRRVSGGVFVRVSPGEVKAELVNNLWVGPGELRLPQDSLDSGNQRVSERIFNSPSDYDFRPSGNARLARVRPPERAEFVPRAEYEHPMGTRPLAQPVSVPGAFQP